MQYNRTRWVNNSTKLNQNNMNNIEDGIEGLVSEVSKTNSRIPNLVNDLTIGGLNDALSAEAGKRLNENILILSERMDKILRVDKSQKIIQKLNKKEAVNIVCYGSNLTYGYDASTSGRVSMTYPDYLQSLLRGYFNYNNIIVNNVGILNAQIDELLLPENLKKVKDINPDLVIFEPGIFDKIGFDGSNPATDFSLLSQRLDQLRDKLKEYDILVLNMPQNVSNGYENSLIQNNVAMRYNDKAYNETFRQFSRRYSLPFIDMRTKINKFMDNDLEYRPTLFTNTVHLNQNGYNKFAEIVFTHFFTPHMIIDREMRVDVLDALWKSTTTLPVASGESSNKDYYNLNCTQNNTIMINFFVDKPFIFVDLIRMLANVEGEIIVSSSSIDNKNTTMTSQYASSIAGTDKRSSSKDYIGKFQYGYNFIKLTFTGTAKLQGLSFYENINPMIISNEVVSNDHNSKYDLKEMVIGNLSQYKTIHLDVVMDSDSNIAIGTSEMAISGSPIQTAPMYSIWIGATNKLVGFYKYQLTTAGVLEANKLASIEEYEVSKTGNICSIDFIQYNNRTEVYFNKILLYTFTVPYNVLGDKNLYYMNYTGSGTAETIRTTLLDVKYLKEPVDINRIPTSILDSDYRGLKTNISNMGGRVDGIINSFDTINTTLEDTIRKVQINTEAIQSIEGSNIDVKTFGAKGDGHTDDTNAFQTAVDSLETKGGGTLKIPRGDYWIKTTVDLPSNIKLDIDPGASFIKNSDSSTSLLFSINRNAIGPGYTKENIIIDGGKFNGNKLGLGLAIQKAKNLIFRNMEFLDCQVDSHIFDLGGVDNVIIENSKFIGRYNRDTSRNYAEAIQLDISSLPGLPNFTGQDGTTTKNVTVRNCLFCPNPEDESSMGFNAIGTHSSWNCYVENITFENNTVVDAEYSMVRIPNAKNNIVRGNNFINLKGNQISAITFDSNNNVYDTNHADQTPSVPTTDGVHYTPKDIKIYNNRFEGFKGNTSTTPIIKVLGKDGYYCNLAEVHDNTFVDCSNDAIDGQDSISLNRIDNVIVGNNIFNNVRRSVYAYNCNNITITDNVTDVCPSNAYSINNAETLILNNNLVKDNYMMAFRLTNVKNLIMLGNNFKNVATDQTNAMVHLASCQNAICLDNIGINTDIKAKFGISVYKSSDSGALNPTNIVVGNNIWDGIDQPERVSAEVVGFRRVNDTINVLDWGVKNDGITDNTVALETMMSSLGNNFARIKFPKGVYKLQYLKVPSNKLIEGDGLESIFSTVVSAKTENTITNRDLNNSNNNIILKNFLIKCNKANAGYRNGFGSGITFANGKNCLVKNVRVEDPYLHCFDAMADKPYQLLNESYANNKTYDVNKRSKNITFINCEGKGAGDDTFTCHYSDYIYYDNCRAYQNKPLSEGDEYGSENCNGFEVDDGTTNITLRNCYAENSARGFEVKAHDHSPAPEHVLLDNCTAVNNVVSFQLRHIGHHLSTDPQSNAKDVILTNCTAINPKIVNNVAGINPQCLQLSAYDGVHIDNFTCIGGEDGIAGEDRSVIAFQYKSRNITANNITIRNFAGNIIGINIIGGAQRTDNVVINNVNIINSGLMCIKSGADIQNVKISNVICSPAIAQGSTGVRTYSPGVELHNITVTGAAIKFNLNGKIVDSVDRPVVGGSMTKGYKEELTADGRIWVHEFGDVGVQPGGSVALDRIKTLMAVDATCRASTAQSVGIKVEGTKLIFTHSYTGNSLNIFWNAYGFKD